jgi:hypothetical protein
MEGVRMGMELAREMSMKETPTKGEWCLKKDWIFYYDK